MKRSADEYPPVPDKGSLQAVLLDFRQVVTGEEHRDSPGHCLMQQVKEYRLDQRIQTAGGFIENQQVRIMLHGTDNSCLLPSAQESCRIFASGSRSSARHNCAALA